METVNILMLVEDSDDDIIITQRKIFKMNIKINEFIVAKTLSEAKQIAQQKHIDVVLLDLNLPETRGLDTLMEFRQVYSGIIIVVTSIEEEFTAVEAIRKGADDYIVKSSMTESLLSRSIIFSKERRKMRDYMAAITDKINTLQDMTGD